MNNNQFRKHAHELIDWIANYRDNIESYPVKSQSAPGDVLQTIANSAPEHGQAFEEIFADFEKHIMPGITHWQHPGFYAYYPANTSGPSILGETLMAALGLQCMSWQTSPAAAELEERVMQWLRELLDLPEAFTGVIQDSASNSTLCSLISARERATHFDTNKHGLYNQRPFTMYCSKEAHSSIEKAVKLAGMGSVYLRMIPVDNHFAMDVHALKDAIEKDKADGLQPLWVVAALGTTGSTAFDPLPEIGKVCKTHGLWLHVDAAFAGTAFIVPEFRHLADGMEYADSFVFNPHKWMLTNFDCSAYFVRDTEGLVNTFAILPEYLKTSEDNRVNNYRDWGPTLARRFRALKLWFVLRSYGAEGLRAMVRNHVHMAQTLATQISEHRDFEIMAPVSLNNICFRYHPAGVDDQEKLNQLNADLMQRVNQTGKAYLTHTKLHGNYVMRLVIGQANTEQQHVDAVWDLIQQRVSG